MIYEAYGKCTCDFGGHFYLSVALYFAGIFNKRLFHSCLLDMRLLANSVPVRLYVYVAHWLSTITSPTRACAIILLLKGNYQLAPCALLLDLHAGKKLKKNLTAPCIHMYLYFVRFKINWCLDVHVTQQLTQMDYRKLIP